MPDDPMLQQRIKARPSTWLVTGVGGVIGSNLLESLLNLDQPVMGLDNFATGKRDNLAEVYGFASIGLRYFNVFGPRQDPDGACAAVIPQWVSSMIRGDPVHINGDGQTVRDFCYVDNVVQANLRAATAEEAAAVNQVYNVALGDKTTLNQLFEEIRRALEPRYPHLRGLRPVYRDFRPGDVRLSQADIGKAARLLGYRPAAQLREGLARAIDWYAAALPWRERRAEAGGAR